MSVADEFKAKLKAMDSLKVGKSTAGISLSMQHVAADMFDVKRGEARGYAELAQSILDKLDKVKISINAVDYINDELEEVIRLAKERGFL